MMDKIKKLICKVSEHKWSKVNAVPEDRETFKCDRCGEWGFDPARVGENQVPKQVVHDEHCEGQ